MKVYWIGAWITSGAMKAVLSYSLMIHFGNITIVISISLLVETKLEKGKE